MRKNALKWANKAKYQEEAHKYTLLLYLLPHISLAFSRFAVHTGVYSAVWYACYLSRITNGIEICYKFATKRHLNYREIQS